MVKVESINIEEVMKLNNPTIIDIREYYYYNMGHINGAISIPYYNLINNYNHYLNTYTVYYLYCETGEQSKKIVAKLSRFGYQTINIIGGYQEYLKVFGT